MKAILFIFILTAFISCKQKEATSRTNSSLKSGFIVKNIPDKENLWVFILAGQSNMAGRGTVEAQDTIPSERIFTINKDGEVKIAKEPLHFYEPSMAGLDCGLSFAKRFYHIYQMVFPFYFCQQPLEEAPSVNGLGTQHIEMYNY
jgi:hypothetical protein